MKRLDHLTEKIADPDNLRLAFWKARKGKTYSAEVERFRQHLDDNLLRLRAQILNGEVSVGKYRFFKIYDPKERQICAPAFDEQVLHHALMNVCHDRFEKAQISDSYASRPGKGTHTALRRASAFTKRYKWYLKVDVQKFFDTIHHDTVKRQLQRLFKDERLQLIFHQIIDSYAASPGRGVPIGNLTSQYFANHFLSALDHFIKRKLGARAYVRYMDDLVVWSDDLGFLKEAHLQNAQFLKENLFCLLKASTPNRCAAGITFLGYRVFPKFTMLSQRGKLRFSAKSRRVAERYHRGDWGEKESQWHLQALTAFTMHADARKFRSQVFSTCF